MPRQQSLHLGTSMSVTGLTYTSTHVEYCYIVLGGGVQFQEEGVPPMSNVSPRDLCYE